MKGGPADWNGTSASATRRADSGPAHVTAGQLRFPIQGLKSGRGTLEVDGYLPATVSWSPDGCDPIRLERGALISGWVEPAWSAWVVVAAVDEVAEVGVLHLPRYPQAHLGFSFKPSADGAQITFVDEGSLADRPGLVEGDLVLAIGEQTLSEGWEEVPSWRGDVGTICEVTVDNGYGPEVLELVYGE